MRPAYVQARSLQDGSLVPVEVSRALNGVHTFECRMNFQTRQGQFFIDGIQYFVDGAKPTFPSTSRMVPLLDVVPQGVNQNFWLGVLTWVVLSFRAQ